MLLSKFEITNTGIRIELEFKAHQDLSVFNYDSCWLTIDGYETIEGKMKVFGDDHRILFAFDTNLKETLLNRLLDNFHFDNESDGFYFYLDQK